jgi:NADPH2:quinone reductase
MKAVVCKQWGPPETLEVCEIPDLTPGPQEVLIQVQAAGINFPDVLIIQNKYQFKPELPFTPGSEACGIVQATGAEVKHFKAGDRVIAFVGHGAFAQQLLAPQQAIFPVPPGMDDDTAAAITLTYGTSHHALLDRAQLKAGETVLVLGASGGVGIAAIEIAKATGARVIAAASSAEKLAVCVEHGADICINYSDADWRDQLKAATGKQGPDVIFDPVGGDYAEAAFRSIAWRGRYLVIGFANGEIPKIPLNLPLLKGASILGVFWGDFVRREPAANLQAMQQLVGWFHEKKIRPHISGRYSLSDCATAMNLLAARKATGKLIIRPQD